MLSAPMMMPLLGQLTRLWWRVVSVVIVSPQLGCWTAAALPAPRTTTPTTASTTASETNVARAAWRRSLVGILSSLSGRARVRVSRRTYTRPLLSTKASIRTRGRADRRPLSSPTWRERSGQAADPAGAAPRGRLLERDRVHRLRDLVDDQVGELGALFPVESLHGRHHADHEERDEQDQADVLDRPLTALALERGDDAAGAAQELRLDVCGELCEHRLPPSDFARCSRGRCDGSRPKRADLCVRPCHH